ncbi:MAG: hypothetical protein PUD50_12175 [Eubacteriales bacterium]|nr:hypothetical protein [Eubacteriales bacterium]
MSRIECSVCHQPADSRALTKCCDCGAALCDECAERCMGLCPDCFVNLE